MKKYLVEFLTSLSRLEFMDIMSCNEAVACIASVRWWCVESEEFVVCKYHVPNESTSQKCVEN